MLTKTGLAQIRKAIKAELKNSVTKTDLKRELSPIKSDIAKIRKDLDVVITLFDREYVNLRKRVETIEEHLGIQPVSV